MGLAEILPGIMESLPILGAGFTKDPNVVTQTVAMSQLGQKQAEKSRLRDFGNAVFAATAQGKPLDEATFNQLLSQHNVPFGPAYDLFTKFSQHRAAKQKALFDAQDRAYTQKKRTRENEQYERDEQSRMIKEKLTQGLAAINMGNTEITRGQLAQAAFRAGQPEWVKEFLPEVYKNFQGVVDEPELAQVKTYDAQGNPVYKWVEKTPGGTVPAYETGWDIQTGPDGTTIRTNVGRGRGGGGSSTELTKSVKSEVQKDIKGLEDRLYEIRDLKNGFDRKYFELEPKAGAHVTNWFDKSTTLRDLFGDRSPEEYQFAEGYFNYSAKAWKRLNKQIKEMSGTAVSAQEMPRVLKAEASPSDGPRQFWNKLLAAEELALAALSRRYHYLQKGMDPNAFDSFIATNPTTKEIAAQGIMPMDQWKIYVEKKAGEIEANILASNPGVDKQQLNQLVNDEMDKIFGGFE
jgi:hypothetical protein